jgi:hypothetical protein
MTQITIITATAYEIRTFNLIGVVFQYDFLVVTIFSHFWNRLSPNGVIDCLETIKLL